MQHPPPVFECKTRTYHAKPKEFRRVARAIPLPEFLLEAPILEIQSYGGTDVHDVTHVLFPALMKGRK